MWKPNIYDENILVVTTELIHFVVKHVSTRKDFNITIVYVFNNHGIRRSLCQDLIIISDQVKEAWDV